MDIAVYGDVHIHTAETKKEVNLHTIRNSGAVNSVKQKVRERDKVCQCCGEVDKILECHHIFPVANYPDLASDINNVQLLCQSCHAKYHNQYKLKDVNPLTYAKFIKENGG